MDTRWERLAGILVNYSARVQPGERVMIAMIEPETFDLAQAVYTEVIRAGGYPQVQLLSERLRRAVLTCGNPDQIAWVPELEAWGMEWADVYFGLRGAHNLHELDDVPPEVLAVNQAAMGRVSSLRWAKTRWTLVRVPNEAFAQQSHASMEIIERMFFSSCFLDWEQEDRKWQGWAQRLGKGRTIRIESEDTDLEFSVAGRSWVPFAGKNNMPDGEIATAPVTGTVHGRIRFPHPGVLGGRLIHGISLRWDHGVLIEASSDTEQEFFQSIITRDEGSSRIGEFAFGTNRGLTRFCNDILLDEKIYGTIHIALGRAYPECGGKNSSAIHWDIVKDLRDGGRVLLDGEPILENGEILL
jgi:aminopeptidase